MRRFIYIITILTTTLMSCQKEEMVEPPLINENKEATITFSLQPNESEVVEMKTKALTPEQERYLRNAEIFCYDNKTGRSTWAYVSGTNTIKLNLTTGSWDIYVLGNHENRLGQISRSELERVMKTITSEADLEKYSCLPMSGKITLEVTGHMRVPIILTRIVAKVNVKINVASHVADKITLSSIRLVNAPKSCRYFGANTPTIGFLSYAERNCKSGQYVSFYLFENRQGVNSSISNQKYKSRENAPANASYLHIKGRTTDKLLDYYIYLGENNTTDFNVIGNRNYTIVVNITGLSQTDWRVEVTDPVKIYVSITQADRSTLTYWPDFNQPIVGSDNSLVVTVNLSQPSQWDLVIPINGVMCFNNEHSVIIDEMVDGFFFPNAKITVPAGATRTTVKFYLELRVSKGHSATLFFNECTNIRFEPDPKDLNFYFYTSGYFHVTNVLSQTIAQYPPN
ncbi:MAG: DUF4906 domain-containing protein [Alistipes sp.]